MPTRIYRYATGYLVVESAADGTVVREEAGLSRARALDLIRPLGWGARAELEAFAEADAHHESGWTDRMRRLEAVRDRADRGAGTDADADFVRGLLADPAYPYRRMFLVDTLRILGSRDESLRLALLVLAQWSSGDEPELALRFVAEQAPERFAGAALRLLRGEAGVDPGLRSWAFAWAGRVLVKAPSAELLEALAAVAGDPKEHEDARTAAQRALADAAGLPSDPRAVIEFRRRDEELPSLVARVRERMADGG